MARSGRGSDARTSPAIHGNFQKSDPWFQWIVNLLGYQSISPPPPINVKSAGANNDIPIGSIWSGSPVPPWRVGIHAYRHYLPNSYSTTAAGMVCRRSWPQAAAMSWPFSRRMVAGMRASSRMAMKASCRASLGRTQSSPSTLL